MHRSKSSHQSNISDNSATANSSNPSLEISYYELQPISRSDSLQHLQSTMPQQQIIPPVPDYYPLITGQLAMKEMKPPRSLSAGQQNSRKDYFNTIWRTAKFSLLADGRLIQSSSSSSSSSSAPSSSYTSGSYRGTSSTLPASGKDSTLTIINVRTQVANRHSIQSSDDSLFGRRYTFQIRPSQPDQPIIYFASPADGGPQERTRWIYYLKQCASGYLDGMDGKPYRRWKRLTVRTVEARGLPTNCDAYCELWLDGERKCRTATRPRCGGQPFWGEQFQFEDLPPVRQGLVVYVMTQNRLSRDGELGKVVVNAAALAAGDWEAWYPIVSAKDNSSSPNIVPQHSTGGGGGVIIISGSSSISSSSGAGNSGAGNSSSSSGGGGGNIISEAFGDLKLRIKVEEDCLLTCDQYSEYREIFHSVKCQIVYDLAGVSTDLESIAMLLLNIYDSRNLAIHWLKSLMDLEIGVTENAQVLFRGNSILTKAMDCYMKVCAMGWLNTAVGDVLREVCEKQYNYEVDPTRLEKGDDLKSNWRRLIQLITTLWQRIEQSAGQIPQELRILFHHLQRKVLQRFNQSREDNYISVRYTSVSGFLFLRLICPAVLNPKLFGLVRDAIEPKTARTLTLLAKTLQCLSNLANFGVKEPFMIDMNSFIMDQSHRMMEFIDLISSSPAAIGGPALIPHCVDEEYSYGSLHRFVKQNRSELEKRFAQYEPQLCESEAISLRSSLSSPRFVLTPTSSNNDDDDGGGGGDDKDDDKPVDRKELPIRFGPSPMPPPGIPPPRSSSRTTLDTIFAPAKMPGKNESQMFTFSNVSLNAVGAPLDMEQLARRVEELRRLFAACDQVEPRIQSKNKQT